MASRIAQGTEVGSDGMDMLQGQAVLFYSLSCIMLSVQTGDQAGCGGAWL